MKSPSSVKKTENCPAGREPVLAEPKRTPQAFYSSVGSMCWEVGWYMSSKMLKLCPMDRSLPGAFQGPGTAMLWRIFFLWGGGGGRLEAKAQDAIEGSGREWNCLSCGALLVSQLWLQRPQFFLLHNKASATLGQPFAVRSCWKCRIQWDDMTLSPKLHSASSTLLDRADEAHLHCATSARKLRQRFQQGTQSKCTNTRLTADPAICWGVL